jgi:GNAT superfamily N-acetyltransferase
MPLERVPLVQNHAEITSSPQDRRMGTDLVVRRAGPDDVAAVLDVLDEAARWLTIRGISGWPTRFRPEWLEPDLRDGRMHLAEVNGAAAGTFTLGWSDRWWSDRVGAGYLRRFAVRRTAAGLGAALIGWMTETVRSRGLDRLRLDCPADNAALRAYYERCGFVHVTTVRLPAEQALWSVPGTMLSLYEKQL